MSTTSERGTLGAGPSTVRAFLHALARKLARIGHAIKHRTGQVLRTIRAISRRVANATATTVTTVFRRSGFEAAVGLLIAGGQVVGYTARSLVRTVGGLLGRAASWVGRRIHGVASHPVVQQAASRIVKVITEPRVAAAVIGVAVIATVIVGWIGLRHRVTDTVPNQQGTVTQLVTKSDRSWRVSQESVEHLMSHLFVILGNDGSVRVHGIPEGWPKKTRTNVARVAAEAAEQRLESLVARGRPLTPVDLQAVNVAARSAVARRLTVSGEVA